jgi:hypothetical protein
MLLMAQFVSRPQKCLNASIAVDMVIAINQSSVETRLGIASNAISLDQAEHMGRYHIV